MMKLKLIVNGIVSLACVAAAVWLFYLRTNVSVLFGCVSVLAAIEFYLRAKEHLPREF